MSTTTTPLGVGLHYGVPASVYHADPCERPSLSSGILRTLLAKSPAHAAMEHSRMGRVKREPSSAMDTGSLVHALLSGSQDEISVGSYPDFKTKAAQTWRDDARAAGRVPVLTEAYEEAITVAANVRMRVAEGITNSPFGPNTKTEVTAIWQEGDAYCRARYDVWVEDEFTIDIWDWKSTRDISDRGIEKAISGLRYDIQEGFYRKGAESVRPKKRVSFIFCFFETVAPFTVRRVVISPTYLSEARKRVSEGIQLWRDCIKNGKFPIKSPETFTVEIPAFLDESETEITVD